MAMASTFGQNSVFYAIYPLDPARATDAIERRPARKTNASARFRVFGRSLWGSAVDDRARKTTAVLIVKR